MQYKDYYKIMGVEKNASAEEIKRSYRKLARKYHPDVSKEANAEEKFKELGEAYEVLKDPEKRAKYDQYGQYWQSQGQQEYEPQGARQGYQFYEAGGGAAGVPPGFEEFINSIFGQRGYQQQAHPFYEQAQDIHAKLNISLMDSFAGAEKTLQLQVPAVDKQGNMRQELRAIRVKIPQGIKDKQQIRLKGQGGKGMGAHPGDLYIEIHIEPHAYFHLHGKNIHLKIPVAPWEAALGATIQVPTLAGAVKVKIPKLAQSGSQMRLKGRGLPGNPAGDQLLTLEIVNPPAMDAPMIKLYEQIAAMAAFNPREKLGVSHEKE